MTREELDRIATEELASRPVFPPANVSACLDLYFRDLRSLPAREVRLAIQAFYEVPVCQRCATRASRWPHAEEIRAQIPEMVREQAAVAKVETCGKCDDGWLLVERTDGVEGVRRCSCALGAAYPILPVSS